MWKLIKWLLAMSIATSIVVFFGYSVWLMLPIGSPEPTSFRFSECVTSNGEEPILYAMLGDFGSEQAPLAMVHGRRSSSLEFEYVAPQVAAAGQPVVLVNLRGHGPSAMPDVIDSDQWTLEALAGDVHQVMTECVGAERYNLLGTSFGGVVDLELLSLWPESLENVIMFGAHLEILSTPDRLIAFDQWTLRWPPFWNNLYQAWAWSDLSRETFQALRRIHVLSAHHSSERDLAMVEQIVHPDDNGLYPERYDYRPAIATFEATGGHFSMIIGEGDWLINGGLADSVSFMDKSPDRMVIHIPGGHYSYIGSTASARPFSEAVLQILQP